MEYELLEARFREIELTQIVHKSLISIMLADNLVSSDSMRITLEDLLAQAIEAREIHVPAELGDAMPDAYRIMRDLLDHVSSQISVPLQPRSIPDAP